MNKLTKFFACAICFIIATGFYNPIKRANGVENSTLGVESTDLLINPDCGFYKAFSGYLQANSSSAPVSEESISKYAGEYGLYHLRIGLESFSSKAGGKDANIDSVALQGLKNTLSYLRKYKMSAIIRFSYNVSGATDSNGDYRENEPSITLITKHIQSLGGAISEYSDVIIGVESGMVGPWGEQHSTALGSSSKSNSGTYHKIVQAWLNSIPEDIGVTVRRPLYFTYWINNEYSLSLSVNDLDVFDCSSYKNVNRVGVYNDGYLGSETDWGTFKNREAEVKFIGKQAVNTLYGGEVIVDDDTGGIGEYNCVSYLEQEAFITHTSYLNIDWNYEKVISVWQGNKYKGIDQTYYDKTSEFTFVNNRLGYRLLLTDIQMPAKCEVGESLNFSFTFLNKGFANMLRKPIAYLIFKNQTVEESLLVDIDLSKVKSLEKKTFSLSAIAPQNLKRGEYDVYLHFITSYGRDIYLANAGDFYNDLPGGFSLGKMVINAPAVRDKYLVTFDSNYGTVVEGKTSHTVLSGQSAVAPTVVREGYKFIGWDVDFSCVTQDLAVTAIWEKLPEEQPEQNSSSIPMGGGCNSNLSALSTFLFLVASCFILLIKKAPK